MSKPGSKKRLHAKPKPPRGQRFWMRYRVFSWLFSAVMVVIASAGLGAAQDPHNHEVTAKICGVSRAYDGYNGSVEFAVLPDSTGVDYFSPTALQPGKTYQLYVSGEVDPQVAKISPDFPAWDILDATVSTTQLHGLCPSFGSAASLGHHSGGNSAPLPPIHGASAR